MAYIYKEDMPKEMELNLNSTFVNRYSLQEKQTESIDYIQRRVSEMRLSSKYIFHSTLIYKLINSCVAAVPFDSKTGRLVSGIY